MSTLEVEQDSYNIKMTQSKLTINCANSTMEKNIVVTADDALLGDPIKVITADEMTALLVEANIGKIYKYIGVTTYLYTYGELYQVVEE